jgi:hypothetical protein
MHLVAVGVLALVGAAGALGCGASSSAVIPAGAETEDGRRRPDGVAIDPAGAPPPTKDRAGSSDGLVTLRTPLGADAARDVVAALFGAITREDDRALTALFAPEAQAVSPAGSGQPARLKDWWEQRFRRLEYTKLAGEPIFRDADLELYRSDDAGETVPHPAVRLTELEPTDVVLRVPVAVSRAGTERLLGEELVIWLRRDGDRYRIYRILEEFQLP